MIKKEEIIEEIKKAIIAQAKDVQSPNVENSVSTARAVESLVTALIQLSSALDIT